MELLHKAMTKLRLLLAVLRGLKNQIVSCLMVIIGKVMVIVLYFFSRVGTQTGVSPPHTSLPLKYVEI